jgi:hypothetical protein
MSNQFKLSVSTLLRIIFCFAITFSELETKAQINAYSFTSTNTTNYVDLVGGTILATATSTISPGNLDDLSFEIPDSDFPFTFAYDNAAFKGCRVYSNGFVVFGAGASANPVAATISPISETSSSFRAISAFGANLSAFYYPGDITRNGEISYSVQGVAPNRFMLIQWRNFKPLAQVNTTFDRVINLQMRIYETTNIIELSYKAIGTFSPSIAAQVGLRGTSNSSYLNRSTTTGWLNTINGSANTSTCTISTTSALPNTLVYKYTPPCFVPTNLTAVNVTQATAQLEWDGFSNGTTKVEYGVSGFPIGSGTVVNNAISPLTISGLTQNTNYQFYVTKTCSAGGTTTANKIFKSGSPTEDCATAAIVQVGSNLASAIAYTNTNGVSRNGPLALCSDAVGNLASNDRWYKFVAPGNNKSIVISTFAGTVNDWTMELWSSCPTSSSSALKCSEDENGTALPEIKLCQNEYVAGQTYYIRLWTFLPSAVGNMTFKVYESTSCIIPPSNDDCLNPISLNVGNVGTCTTSNQVFTTANATISTGQGSMVGCESSNIIKDVWFVFNTGNLGAISFTFNKITATSLKAALMFECGNSGVLVKCMSPAQGTITTPSNLNPQANYYLRVWSDTGGEGTFSVCLADSCDDPTAIISGNETICSGGTANLKVDLTGTPPWSFTYTDQTTSTNVTNVTTTPYYIQVSPVTNKSYTITAVNSAFCAGTVPQSNASVTISAAPVVTFAVLPTICSNTTLSLSQGSPSGGVYSGPGLTGNNFNPSALGAGIYTLTYTYGTLSGCQSSANRNITVIPAPIITSFLPTQGIVGTSVNIFGIGFNSINTVKFGNAFATFNQLSTTSISAILPTGANTGLIYVGQTNGCSTQSSINFTLSNPTNIQLNIKAFIQGFYIGGGQMNAVLDPIALPLVTDSIKLSLMTAFFPYNEITSRTGIIHTNGNASFIFPSTFANNNYYLVVKHRNSIETWSSSPVFIGNSDVNFDFTVPR